MTDFNTSSERASSSAGAEPATTMDPGTWREHVRHFFETHVDDALRARADDDGTEFDESLYQAFVEARFTGLAIPRQYGGLGCSYAQMAAFAEEAALAQVPHGVLSLFNGSAYFAANAMLRLGTEEQKSHFLPAILNGTARFTQGFTEPEAGSDLAGVRMRADVDGDEFVLNGDKVFNSAHLATHIILVTRTDPSAPPHRGISLIVSDLAAEGVTITPLTVLRGWRRNAVHFDSVHQPRQNLVGTLNRGWYELMSLMDLERSGAGLTGELIVSFQLLLDYLLNHAGPGDGDAMDVSSQRRLADLFRKIWCCRLLSAEVVRLQERGLDATLAASMQKLYGSELKEELAHACTDMLGPISTIEWRSVTPASKQWSPLRGLPARLYKDARTAQIAGGTSEIQRNIIAQRGLGLPRDTRRE